KLDESVAEPKALLTIRILDDSIEQNVLQTTDYNLSHFDSPSLALSYPLRHRRRQERSGRSISRAAPRAREDERPGPVRPNRSGRAHESSSARLQPRLRERAVPDPVCSRE